MGGAPFFSKGVAFFDFWGLGGAARKKPNLNQIKWTHIKSKLWTVERSTRWTWMKLNGPGSKQDEDFQHLDINRVFHQVIKMSYEVSLQRNNQNYTQTVNKQTSNILIYDSQFNCYLRSPRH